MAADKLDIYRWDRFSKPRVYSRSQRVTSDDDIQGWIKKVEDASNRAAEVALGSEYPAHSRSASRHSAKATVDYVLAEDSAHTEAKELLQQWMTDKLSFDDNFEDDDEDDTWAKPRKTQSEIKKEWDHLLEMNDPSYHSHYPDGPLTPKSSGRNSSRSKDPYSILNEDPDDVVDDILNNMLEKDFVSDYVVRDLGLTEKKGQDPRTKMKLRQQKVKENREKRMKELEQQRRDKQAKKEAEFEARQQVKQEELRKTEAAKKEETEIKKEMARIRKEMEEDRKKHDEQKIREKREAEERDRLAKEEFERQIAAEQSEQKYLTKREEEKKRKIMERMKHIQQREAIQNFRTLQKYFNAWYDLVLRKRLKMGKARAMSDWKCLVRAWNGWKSYVRDKRLDREAHKHKQDVIASQRKQHMSIQHYHRTLLLKCWLSWQHYVSLERQRKDVKAEQGVTRNKMASFLQAAASGHLWAKEDADNNGQDNQNGVVPQTVDDFFVHPGRPVQSRLDSSRSDPSTSRSKSSKKLGPPAEAFQVKREHIKLIKTPGHSGDSTARSIEGENGEDGANNHLRKNSWQKPPFVVNNMENRHNAQQKILEQQQKQIKEQQKLIEDLTHLQKQQLLQQQLTTQALLQQQQPGNDGVIPEANAVADDSQNMAKDRKFNAKNAPSNQLHNELNIERDLATSRSNTNRTGTNRTDSAKAHTNRSDNSTSRTAASTARITSTARTNPKHVEFLKAMEDRAAERERLKKAREEKRRKEEDEKLAKLLAEEAERKEREEEEKRKRVESHRERKRLEKQREMDRQKEQERMKELTERADEHSRLATLRYRGWLRWQRLMQIAKEKEERAKQHYKQSLMRRCLISWHHTVAAELHGKRTMADEMHSYILIKRCFYNWRRVGETAQILEEKAGRHYERRLKLKVVQEWADVTAQEKIGRWHRERQAREYNTERIKKKAFRALRSYPRYIQEEREREKRRAEMRKKVASMLPDFNESKSTRTSISSSMGDP